MELPLVWIIDDDNLFYMITKNNLRKTGIETTTEFFYDGLDSLNALLERVKNKQTLPVLIILDLNMPLYDGWSFLQGYMNLPPETRSKMKLHICTSSIDPADISRAESIPDVLGFQEKPLSADLLLALLTE
jgi:CheY-like chemotaxis protein